MVSFKTHFLVALTAGCVSAAAEPRSSTVVVEKDKFKSKDVDRFDEGNFRAFGRPKEPETPRSSKKHQGEEIIIDGRTGFPHGKRPEHVVVVEKEKGRLRKKRPSTRKGVKEREYFRPCLRKRPSRKFGRDEDDEDSDDDDDLCGDDDDETESKKKGEGQFTRGSVVDTRATEQDDFAIRDDDFYGEVRDDEDDQELRDILHRQDIREELEDKEIRDALEELGLRDDMDEQEIRDALEELDIRDDPDELELRDDSSWLYGRDDLVERDDEDEELEQKLRKALRQLLNLEAGEPTEEEFVLVRAWLLDEDDD